MADSCPVLIAGAGMAGLTCALALAKAGIPSRILERRAQLSEAGAGIQLGPNAMRVLGRLGVAPHLEASAGRPDAIVVSDGASGRRIASLPLGKWLEERHGAPYRVFHRADLQAGLLDAVERVPEIALETGFHIADVQASASEVVVQSAEGAQARGPMLVGADGAWSTVRSALFPTVKMTFAGKMAMRTVIPIAKAPSRFAEAVTGLWLSRDAHVVHYPVRAHRDIAVVAIVDEKIAREGWGNAIDGDEVLARLSGFSRELTDFLANGENWGAWSLYKPLTLPAWSRGCVGLIGDAAHPVLPFLAQGGAMAIEDAETLGGAIAAHRADPAMAFRRFEMARRARVERMLAGALRNGRIYHLSGVMGMARDAVLRVTPGVVMMAQYDWLYGWSGDAA